METITPAIRLPEAELKTLLHFSSRADRADLLEELRRIDALSKYHPFTPNVLGRLFHKRFSNHTRNKIRTVRIDFMGRLLMHFFQTETFELLCTRLEQQPNGISSYTRFVEKQPITEWFLLWMMQNYPIFSKVVLKLNISDKYKKLSQIPLDQTLRYVPLFVIYRIGSTFRNSNEMDWIECVAVGKNIREARHLPFPVSKKMAHLTINAPKYYSFREALFHGLLKSLGITDGMYPVLFTYYQSIAEIRSQQIQIMRFCINHCTALDEQEIRRILSYLEHCFTDGEGFRFKGRTGLSVLRLAEVWHQTMQLENSFDGGNEWYRSPVFWDGAPYQGKTWTDAGEDYRIIQILNSKDLIIEGYKMRHCVGTYSGKCMEDKCSIWSLQSYKTDLKAWEPLVTIEINTSTKEIVQAKKRFNAYPNEIEMGWIKVWAEEEGVKW